MDFDNLKVLVLPPSSMASFVIKKSLKYSQKNRATRLPFWTQYYFFLSFTKSTTRASRETKFLMVGDDNDKSFVDCKLCLDADKK